MKTSKPIATISWNTPAYLERVCKELQASKIVAFWCYILHLGEDDEAGKKNHIHLYMEPARCVQTLDLKELFNEPDPTHKKPLGCLDFRPSKFSDWYWYALHDEAYLKSKGQERKYHYKPDSVINSSPDEMQYRIGTIEPVGSVVVDRMKRLSEAGKSFDDMILAGAIPIGNLRNCERIFAALEMALSREKRAGLRDSSGKSLAGRLVVGNVAQANLATPTPARENDSLSPDLPFDGTITTRGIKQTTREDNNNDN